MIFVTGPLFAGKREWVRRALGLSGEELTARGGWDVRGLAGRGEDRPALARELEQKEIVIATEVGGGVVPVDPAERLARERAGRLSCLLAQRARVVVRVCCGLPQVLKGELPCAST